MRFKFLIFFFLFNFLGSIALSAAENIYPLGLVVRPKFINHLIERLNEQHRAIPLQVETDFFLFDGQIQAEWSPKWTQNSGRLIFKTDVRNLKISGDLYERTSKRDWAAMRPQNKSMVAAIAFLPLDVIIDPITLEIFLDIQWDNKDLMAELPDPEKVRTPVEIHDAIEDLILSKMALGIQGLDQINGRLNDKRAKQKVLEAILKEGGRELSNYFQKTIFGLGYGEFLSKATPLSPLWKQGPLFQKDALTLELAEPSSRQREIAFAFHRFAEGGIIATDNQLEIYVNALFLNHDLFGSMTGLNTNFTNPETLLSQSMIYLKSNPAHFPSEWRRPEITESEGDLSVVIPKALINLALSTVYKEGLLRFRTKLDIGKTTKSLLAEDAPENYLVANINPNQAPKLDFDADRLQLDITDYSLDIGTYIEDRIIPQTSLRTRTHVSAELTVDNKAQYLNLQLNPSTFQISLKDPKRRLSESEMSVFKDISEKLWKEFLSSYSQLNLFKTVINTDNAPIEIINVRVAGQNILLNLKVDWENAKI